MPDISSSIITSGGATYLNASSVDITFVGPPGTPYSITGIQPSQIQTRTANTYPTIPSSGIVSVTLFLSNGVNIISILFYPDTPYMTSLTFTLIVNTSPITASSSSTSLSLNIPLQSSYTIYINGSPTPFISDVVRTQPLTIPFSLLPNTGDVQSLMIQYSDVFGNTKTFQYTFTIQTKNITYAPPPIVRTYYPTQKDRIEKKKIGVLKISSPCCPELYQQGLTNYTIDCTMDMSSSYQGQAVSYNTILTRVVQENGLLTSAPPPSSRTYYPTQNERVGDKIYCNTFTDSSFCTPCELTSQQLTEHKKYCIQGDSKNIP